MTRPAIEPTESSDRALLDLIRRRGPLAIAEMATALGVTATAIRHRLARLVETGLVERRSESSGRGRPKHLYHASAEAHRRLGQNYTDLALVLWDEMMRTIEDRKLRRLLFTRITERLAEIYRAQVRGEGWESRLSQLEGILHDRGIEAEVVRREGSPLSVLTQHSCPYYDLAENDAAICALERKMLEKVLGQAVRLAKCRLNGHRSCDFEAKPNHLEISPSQAS